MTKKDLFRIILKIAGLYFLVVTLFQALPGLSVFFANSPWLSIVLFIVVLLIFATIFLALIFKPDALIKSLKLDKGFDSEEVMLKRIDFSDLLKIAIFAIGLSLIVRYLPPFITHAIFLFKLLVKGQNDISSQMQSGILTDYISWGVKIISLIIGYLMITNYASLANYFMKKQAKNEE